MDQVGGGLLPGKGLPGDGGSRGRQRTIPGSAATALPLPCAIGLVVQPLANLRQTIHDDAADLPYLHIN